MKTKNIYSLPFAKDALTLAVSDPKAHYGSWKNAIDFLCQYDVPILAALKGKVIDVKDNSNIGGNDKKFADTKYQNYITIKHGNEEYSQYVHLNHKSSLVKKGDLVKMGQPIAKGIGMVRYTTAPHLHLIVFKEYDNNEDGFESLKIEWKSNAPKIHKGESLAKEIQKPKYKPLREAIVKSQNQLNNKSEGI